MDEKFYLIFKRLFFFILEEKYFSEITNNFKNILLFIDYIKFGH
jgi:hypothetical protein